MKATILFGHGARNAEYVKPFHRIRDALLAKSPDTMVDIGFLELTQPALEAVIECQVSRGATSIVVVPIFFAPGRHVLKDLPELVASALDRYPDVNIDISSCVGEVPNVIDAMAEFALSAASGSDNK